MSTLAPELAPARPDATPSADALDRALRNASPAEVIAAALKTIGREQLALVSSFGTESAALLKVMADVDPSIPVIFLDTGWLFEETLAYRDTLTKTLGLTDVRSIKPLEETLTALDSLVRAGKVRYLGFSNWSAWKTAAALEFQKANGLARFTHGQMHYSLLGRDIERDVVPMMRRYGLGMTVWSPLSSGFLSGKYTREVENAHSS